MIDAHAHLEKGDCSVEWKGTGRGRLTGKLLRLKWMIS